MATKEGPKQHQQQRGTAGNSGDTPRSAPAQNGKRDDAADVRERSRSPTRRTELSEGDNASGQEPEKNKVFVGNLAYGITEDELKAYFAQIGKVLNATIVKRRGRPVGFGFVTFENEDVAQRAVSTLDQTMCDGRQINVEVTASRPRERKPRGEGRPRRLRNPRRRGSERNKAENKQQGQDAEAHGPPQNWDEEKLADENGAERRPARRPRARRERKPRNRPQAGEGGEQLRGDSGEVDAAAEQPAEQEQRKRRRQRNRKRAPVSGENGAVPAAEGEVAGEDRPARPRRGSRAPRRQKGPLSDRTVFVANLPIAMSTDQLQELFSEYKTVGVRIIQRRGSRRNKGFGFVEMADHEEQTRAIDELQGDRSLQFDGRILTLRVAREEVDGSQEADGGYVESSSPVAAAAINHE